MLMTFCPLTCVVRITSYKKEKHYIIRNNRNLDIYGKKKQWPTSVLLINIDTISTEIQKEESYRYFFSVDIYNIFILKICFISWYANCCYGKRGLFFFLNVSEPEYHIALPQQPVWTVLDIHWPILSTFRKLLYRGRVAVFKHCYQYIQ